jgi:hypothetical protein
MLQKCGPARTGFIPTLHGEFKVNEGSGRLSIISLKGPRKTKSIPQLDTQASVGCAVPGGREYDSSSVANKNVYLAPDFPLTDQ